jgi:hypothetical protein
MLREETGEELNSQFIDHIKDNLKYLHIMGCNHWQKMNDLSFISQVIVNQKINHEFIFYIC